MAKLQIVAALVADSTSSGSRLELPGWAGQSGGAGVGGSRITGQAIVVAAVAVVGEVASHTAGACCYITVHTLQDAALAGIDLGSGLALGTLCGRGASCTKFQVITTQLADSTSSGSRLELPGWAGQSGGAGVRVTHLTSQAVVIAAVAVIGEVASHAVGASVRATELTLGDAADGEVGTGDAVQHIVWLAGGAGVF